MELFGGSFPTGRGMTSTATNRYLGNDGLNGLGHTADLWRRRLRIGLARLAYFRQADLTVVPYLTLKTVLGKYTTLFSMWGSSFQLARMRADIQFSKLVACFITR